MTIMNMIRMALKKDVPVRESPARRLRAALCVVFSLIGTGSGTAQELLIEGQLQSPPYRIVRLVAANVKPNAVVVWDVIDDQADVIEHGTTLLMTGPPGKYRVVCTEIAIVNAIPQIRRQRAVVEIANHPNPGPPVPPQPQPPQPQPTQRKLYLVVIEETAQASANRANIMTDAALRERMSSRGHRYVIADKDVIDGATGEPPKELRWYLDRAKGKPLPRLFAVDIDSSRLVWEGDVPGSASAIISLLQSLGG